MRLHQQVHLKFLHQQGSGRPDRATFRHNQKELTSMNIPTTTTNNKSFDTLVEETKLPEVLLIASFGQGVECGKKMAKYQVAEQLKNLAKDIEPEAE
jgi:hypothetical protein